MPDEFTMTRRVTFAETDAAGIMHFANYYRMMEEVEHEFWRSLGMSVLTVYQEQHLTWPRVATSCEYFAPTYFEDVLELRMTIAHVGDRSVTYAVDFLREGNRVAAGRTTAVCCLMGKGTFKPTSIPDSIRSRLMPLLSKGTDVPSQSGRRARIEN